MFFCSLFYYYIFLTNATRVGATDNGTSPSRSQKLDLEVCMVEKGRDTSLDPVDWVERQWRACMHMGGYCMFRFDFPKAIYLGFVKRSLKFADGSAPNLSMEQPAEVGQRL
jgi:hypothetical protein